MKSMTKSTIVVAITIILALTIVGCNEEQQQTPSSKKARLIAIENMQLKEQIGGLDGEIKALQGQLQGQKDLVKKCQEENNSLKLKKQEEGAEVLMQLLISEDTEKQDMKKQIETLKQKVKQLQSK